MKVKDSPLYKTLCEAVRKEDHAELLRMLEMIDWNLTSSTWAGLASGELTYAFPWGISPQGRGYWRELADRLRSAGWECW